MHQDALADLFREDFKVRLKQYSLWLMDTSLEEPWFTAEEVPLVEEKLASFTQGVEALRQIVFDL